MLALMFATALTAKTNVSGLYGFYLKSQPFKATFELRMLSQAGETVVPVKGSAACPKNCPMANDPTGGSDVTVIPEGDVTNEALLVAFFRCICNAPPGPPPPANVTFRVQASSPAYRQTTNNIMTPLRGANPMGRQAQAPPQTPMSSQLESVGWLREAVMHVEADSTALARYFDACERSPKNSIDERVKKFCTQVQTVLSASELATDLSEQLQLGQKLYYKMLLAFLEAEERRKLRTLGPQSPPVNITANDYTVHFFEPLTPKAQTPKSQDSRTPCPDIDRCVT